MMNPRDLFEGLEQGRLDVAQALERLRSAEAAQRAASGAGVDRPSAGRVPLRPLGDAGGGPAPEPAEAAPRAPSGRKERLRARAEAGGGAAAPAEPASVAGTGEAVRLERPSPGVAVIALEDEAQRNALGPLLGAGLARAADEIRGDDAVRVVVVHGRGTWFCGGGTPEGLAAIRAGEARFTDFAVFRLLLDLEVPTIAAMQGHAFGGGFAFGLYADLIVVAEESCYAGNFLEHGFTPGMGATWLLPRKLGEVLGTEMLYTARRYTGRELVDRGAALRAEPRDRVIDCALELAGTVAAMPRDALRLLKRSLTAEIRRSLPAVIEAELAMHRELFGASGR
jgi:polyketide biosynthesis enoyl-CoA hydratase PksI